MRCGWYGTRGSPGIVHVAGIPCENTPSDLSGCEPGTYGACGERREHCCGGHREKGRATYQVPPLLDLRPRQGAQPRVRAQLAVERDRAGLGLPPQDAVAVLCARSQHPLEQVLQRRVPLDLVVPHDVP